MRRVLPAAAGRRDLWHRHGYSWPDAHRHLLWQHHHIVSQIHQQTAALALHLIDNMWVTTDMLIMSACPFTVMKPAQVLSCVLNCTVAAQRMTTQQGARRGNWPVNWAHHLGDQRGRSSGQPWSLDRAVLLPTEGQLLFCSQFPQWRKFFVCFSKRPLVSC